MTKIIVLSDTHGNHQLLRKPFAQESDYDMIIHLGDNYEDMQDNYDLYEGAILMRVPGIFHARYHDGSLPAILHVDVDGWNIGMVHHLADYFKQKVQGDIVLYGHTHHGGISGEDGIVYANPGHLKSEFDRNREPSYLVMEVSEEAAVLRLKSLRGNTIIEKRCKR